MFVWKIAEIGRRLWELTSVERTKNLFGKLLLLLYLTRRVWVEPSGTFPNNKSSSSIIASSNNKSIRITGEAALEAVILAKIISTSFFHQTHRAYQTIHTIYSIFQHRVTHFILSPSFLSFFLLSNFLITLSSDFCR